MMTLLPLCICFFMQLPRGTSRKRLIPYATAPAFTLVAMCLIGTKTAFIGVGAAVAAPFVFALVEFFRKKDRTLLVRLAIILVIFGLTLGCLMLFASANVLSMISESLQAAGDISEREGAATALLSGRQDKLKRAFDQYRDGGLYCILFGLGRGTQPVSYTHLFPASRVQNMIYNDKHAPQAKSCAFCLLVWYNQNALCNHTHQEVLMNRRLLALGLILCILLSGCNLFSDSEPDEPDPAVPEEPADDAPQDAPDTETDPVEPLPLPVTGGIDWNCLLYTSSAPAHAGAF